jgi:hypothetical protein
LKQFVNKSILRRAIGGRLPPAVARRRDKMGFEVPQRAWLAAGRTEVTDLVLGGQIVRRGWVTPTEVERVLSEGLGGGRKADHLWRLFMLEAWLRMLWPNTPGVGGRSTWEAAVSSEPLVRRPLSTDA